jgi:hypothetical protein
MIFLSRNKCGTLPENSAMVDGLITEEEMKMPAVFPRCSNLEYLVTEPLATEPLAVESLATEPLATE